MAECITVTEDQTNNRGELRAAFMSPAGILAAVDIAGAWAMEGDAPPSPRQQLVFEASSHGFCLGTPALDSPSMASMVSCSTEGLRCFTP